MSNVSYYSRAVSCVYGLYGDERLPCSVSWWSSVATSDFADPVRATLTV
jgi:hypothetical protein